MSRVPRGYRMVAAVVVGLVRVLRWRLDVAGVEHVPASGGAVLTWNHVGHLDVVATAVPVWLAHRRNVRFLALRDLFDRPVVGLLVRLAGCVPVDRDTATGRDDAYRDAVAALRAGDLVMVAPEGTISPTGDLLPFRTGAARMARDAGVPLVPSASYGTRRLATTDRGPSLRRAWRLPVAVRFGPPLHVGAHEDPAAATGELARRTQHLLDTARAARD